MRKSRLACLALLAALLLGLLPVGAQSWDDIITGAPPPGRSTPPPKRLIFMIAVKATSKSAKPPSGCEVVQASGGYYFVSRRASVSMEVQSARLVTTAPGKGRKAAARSVVVQLKQNSIRLFSDFTRNNLGKPVVISRKGEVITAWKISRKISDGRLMLPAKGLTQRQLKALIG